jgi:hypothetical protein
MRRTAGYIWTDYKTNTQITKELKITQILNKLLEYKRNWIKGKAIPLQTWTGPEFSRRLRLPDFKTFYT